MNKWLLTASHFTDRFSKWVMGVCFAAAFLATIYQVISRYGFNNSYVIDLLPFLQSFNFPWLEELIRYLFVWGVFLGIGVVYKIKGHAHVELILHMLPQKLRGWFELTCEVFNSILFIILFIYGIEMVKITDGQVSSMLGINMPVMYTSIIICALICFIHSLAFSTQRLSIKNKAELSKDNQINSVGVTKGDQSL